MINLVDCLANELWLLIKEFWSFSPVSTAVTYDKSIKAIKVKVPDSDEEFLLHPATVRRNDRSAQSVVCRKFF